MAQNVLTTFLFDRERRTAASQDLARSKTVLVGRILLGTIFVMAGVQKLMDWSATAAYMESQGLPAITVLLGLAAATEILGGLSIITGTFARAGALALFLFLIPTTVVFHDFWSLEGQAQQTQMTNFLKNLSIMGGLLLMIGVGAGRVSVDRKIRRQLDTSA